MMDKVKAVADFFNKSPKRQQLLEKNIDNLLQGQRQRKLIDVCRTRWIARINDLIRFQQMSEPIKVTLEEIKNNAEGYWNYDSVSIAADLLFAFDFKFIISLVITRNILNYSKAPTKKLQGVETDVMKEYQEIDLLKSTVMTVRKNINEYHRNWFEEATKLAGVVDSSPAMPRICERQTMPDN